MEAKGCTKVDLNRSLFQKKNLVHLLCQLTHYLFKFHASKQEEPVTTKLLIKATNIPGLTRKHGGGGRTP